MTRRERLIVSVGCILLALSILMPDLLAQLQQSGGPGSTVTIGSALPAGANVIGKVSIDQTTPGTTNAVALTAGLNTIGVIIPKTPCGTTVFNQDLAAVPTVTGSPTSTTTCIMRAYFNNTNATAQTVTLTDNTGTPLNALGPAFSVPGLSNLVIPYDGIRFNAGIKWVAGGTGVTGAIWGFQ